MGEELAPFLCKLHELFLQLSRHQLALYFLSMRSIDGDSVNVTEEKYGRYGEDDVYGDAHGFDSGQRSSEAKFRKCSRHSFVVI